MIYLVQNEYKGIANASSFSLDGKQLEGEQSFRIEPLKQENKNMLRPTVIKATPSNNYILFLEFDNGEEKQFDVKPYIKGSWFGKLSDISYFKSVKTNGFNVEWPEGQDICPDDLYFNSL